MIGQKILLSLASIVIVSNVVEISKTQAVESHAMNTIASTASLAQSTTAQQSAKSGSFVSGEHTTQGTVRIVTKNGKSFLELNSDFKTSNLGPDLVVALHKSNNVIGNTKPPAYPLKKGEYIVLAPLKKFSGAQSYPIPNNVNLAQYKSAVIWCRKFNATFGAANLSN